MNQKMLMYLMTGNIMFMFLPTQMALMMMMMGINLGGTSGGIQTSSTSSAMSNVALPLMLMSGMGKSSGGYRRRYSRPRTYVNNRYYGSRRRY